ncbi:MFS transporter [Sporosarcina sp. BI001-red]|uniref:CynX/NimT family MFS transporter n=1 Tax=Sporosarcina sp. BI001-red TaxID=2282866 RepID=UPI000E271BDF|nr:MFS transporter [Sporosarcina sp. BI001-red]REB08061.1 MFS transporter [Sporosarcina sp. BI001-red]
MNKNEGERERPSSAQRSLLLIAIVVIGFNLRPAITSVGPLLSTIRDEIGLSNWSAGIIASLPLIAFAAMSTVAARFGNRFGNMTMILVGLFLLSGGTIARSIPYTPLLFIGTAVIGVGIALMNVLLPAFIKEKFPNKVGRMTSVYSTAMCIFAATASGLSIPLATGAGLGWQLSLGSWVLLSAAGAVLWIVVMRQDNFAPEDEMKVYIVTKRKGLWGSALAWQVTLFMGLQSFAFYTLVSWLPEILTDYGFSPSSAGWTLSIAQFVSIPSTFIAPLLAEKFRKQSGIAAIAGGLYTLGYAGLLLGGSPEFLVVSSMIIGLASGATISLSLAFLGMRSRDGRQAGQLSGMAQSVGYLLAASGPILIGLLYDVSENWRKPLMVLVGVCLLMTAAGIGAGRNKFVSEEVSEES